MKLLAKLEKNHHSWFLIGISLIFVLLRIPSLFEPYWYGDEGIYEVLGSAISQGRLLYRDIWDNKPPLLYLLYAVFQGDQFWARFISLLVGLGSVWIFYWLAKKLFEDYRVVYGVTIFFAFFFGIPLIEGNIANAENFMLLPILTAGLLVFTTCKSIQKEKSDDLKSARLPISRELTSRSGIQLFFAGLLLSIAFLFKVVAVFDTAAFFLFFAIISYKDLKSVPRLVIHIIPYAVGFLLPIILTSLYFIAHGAFADFFNACFKQNVGYVGYGNKFIIGQGLLVIKLLGVLTIVGVLFFKRKKINPSFLFIYLWVAFSLFNAFFSQRSYTHYMLVLLPSFSLLLGTIIPTHKKMTVSYLIGLGSSIIILWLLIHNFNFYNKTFSYYRNFFTFVQGDKSVRDYLRFFDRNTPKDYELVKYLNQKMRKEDTLFIWGNNAQVYKLTNKLPPGRYTVAYHMTSNDKTLQETQDDIERVKPTYILVTSPRQSIPFALSHYQQKIMIQDAILYEYIF